MARLSDAIEEFIKRMMDNGSERELQIQRNELADYFSCAPSQINYVLTTRFTVDRGYYIESKRGGGGCIIIRHVEFDEHKSLWDIINDRIGNSITYDGGMQIIDGLLSSDIITERESNIMKAA
jgi:transcriptional regulator CtsR